MGIRLMVDEYKKLFINSNKPIFLVKIDGSIIEFNKEAQLLLRYSTQQILNQKFYNFFSEQYVHQFERMAKNKITTQHLYLISKDNNLIPVELNSKKIKFNGKEILQIYVDGTNLGNKMLKEINKAMTDMNKQQYELEETMASIYHDFKTPLISINNFCRLLSVEYHDNLDKNGQDYIKRIEKNIARILNLTNDIIEFSKLGKFQYLFKKVSSFEIIDSSIISCLEELKEKKIEIIYRIEYYDSILKKYTKIKVSFEDRIKNEKLLIKNFPMIYCDKDRIIRVFIQLINNGIRYMGNQPQPKIEIGFQQQKSDRNLMTFFVKDNGMGIAKPHFKFFFTPFYRVKNIQIQKQGIKGTGLGLATAKRIVEGHGGYIDVISKEGKGSNFFINIPL